MEAYRHDIAGLSGKAARPIRSRWHNAAARYLNLLSITSDPVPSLPTETIAPTDENGSFVSYADIIIRGKKVRVELPPYQVTVVPIASRFLQAGREELSELWRATKLIKR